MPATFNIANFAESDPNNYRLALMMAGYDFNDDTVKENLADPSGWSADDIARIYQMEQLRQQTVDEYNGLDTGIDP